MSFLRPITPFQAIYLTIPLVLVGCEVDLGRSRPVETMSQSIDLDRSEMARVQLTMKVGELRVSGGSSKLMDGDFVYVNGQKPVIRYQPSGFRANLSIEQPGGANTSSRGDRYKWDLRFNNDVPINVAVDFGVGQAKLDIGTLNLRGLDVHMGVGQASIDLRGTPRQDYAVNLRGGIGEATVYLPSDVGIIAEAHGGIGGVHVHGLQKREGRYVNDAYGHSKYTIRLDVAGGIGAINLNAS